MMTCTDPRREAILGAAAHAAPMLGDLERTHLRECASCQVGFQRLTAVAESMQLAPLPGATVARALRQAGQRPTRSALRRPASHLLLALCAPLFAVTAFGMGLDLLRHRSQGETELAAPPPRAQQIAASPPRTPRPVRASALTPEIAPAPELAIAPGMAPTPLEGPPTLSDTPPPTASTPKKATGGASLRLQPVTNRQPAIQRTWSRAAEALAREDVPAAERALGDLSAAPDGATRDPARLALAELWLLHGRAAEATPVLRALAHQGSTAFVRRRAQELLSGL